MPKPMPQDSIYTGARVVRVVVECNSSLELKVLGLQTASNTLRRKKKDLNPKILATTEPLRLRPPSRSLHSNDDAVA